MALNTSRYTSSWRDAKGWIGRVTVFISEDTGAAGFPNDMSAVAVAVKNAIGGLTNAAFQSDSGIATANLTALTYGDNLEYPAEWQKAVFTFSTDINTIHRYKIPAPEIDIFDTDGITVLNDGTQAQVVAFVNAMKNVIGGAFVSSKSGLPLTHFEGGIARLGKQPRRFNGRVKSSHLVQGEGE